MDRFEGFGKSTPLNPLLRNRWVYKRSSSRRKATYNFGLYYRIKMEYQLEISLDADEEESDIELDSDQEDLYLFNV